LSCLIILAQDSYPALVFRASAARLAAIPLSLVNWMPQRLDLARENRELRRRATVLFVESSRLQELAREAGRLEEMLGLEPRPGLSYLPARVIARSSPFGTHSVVLDRGRVDGVTGGEALVTPWGLAGLVVDVGRASAAPSFWVIATSACGPCSSAAARRASWPAGPVSWS
jgi:hypothetical protein